ncbi:MAG: hypothetical protein ACLFP4_09690 [Spirochaetales bacterium]
MRRSVFHLLLISLLALPIAAQSDDPDLRLSEQMLEEVEAGDTSQLQFGGIVDHYDEHGFPESATGQLVLEPGPAGPEVFVEDESDPYLLYAQFQNLQRDAVFLARTGPITDVLPSGDQFPLNDLYLSGGLGLSGATAGLRFVLVERYVGYARAGLNIFGGSRVSGVYNQIAVPIHVGAGIRFPSPVRLPFTGSNWTVGGDALVGIGDGDNDPATPAASFFPGAFLDIEQVLYDERGARRDFRNDPRPYNYNAHSIIFRLGAYLNLADPDRGLIVPMFELSYHYSILGPDIPDHEFKETEVLYVDELYVDGIREQIERRRERNEAE